MIIPVALIFQLRFNGYILQLCRVLKKSDAYMRCSKITEYIRGNSLTLCYTFWYRVLFSNKNNDENYNVIKVLDHEYLKD